MLMVIAGAGASFDSIPFELPYEEARGYQLPLANDLFGVSQPFLEIQAQYPALKQIWSRLHIRRDANTVEDVLFELQKDALHNPARHEQLVAVRYYLQELIDTCEQRWYRGRPVPTNMIGLLDQIENERAKQPNRAFPAFVTFNYDRLIEDSLSNRGFSFDSMDSYVAPKRPPLFKLHGSVNWVRSISRMQVTPRDGSRREVSKSMAESFSQLTRDQFGEIQMVRSISSVLSEHGANLPAIAIPIKGKSFECPEGHIQKLKEVLPQVRCILTVGWRGEEDHFLAELKAYAKGPIEGICVGKDRADADPIAKRLMRALPNARFAAYEGRGFSQFVRDNAVDQLLALAWEK